MIFYPFFISTPDQSAVDSRAFVNSNSISDFSNYTSDVLLDFLRAVSILVVVYFAVNKMITEI